MTGRPGAVSAPVFRFRELVCARLGLRFDDARLPFLDGVLRRRSRAANLLPTVLLDRLERAPEQALIAALAEELTVGETYFFRHAEQLAAFASVLPPLLAARAETRQLRLLSAGCSSGEEPYTLAMLAAEAVPQGWQIGIDAVDLNPAALRRARNARYGNWSLRETPAASRGRWFRREGRDAVVVSPIREMVAFASGNLADPEDRLWQAGPYDAIFCRNVVMYFPPDVQAAAVARLQSILAPDGYLFLGHAETLRGISEAFALVQAEGAFYYRARSGEAVPKHRASPLSLLAPRKPSRTAPVRCLLPPPPLLQRARPVAPKLRVEGAPAADALVLWREERFAEALDLLDRSNASEEGADRELYRAMLCLQLGRLAEGAELAAALLVRELAVPDATHILGLCLEAAGDRTGALLHYRRAAVHDPDFAMPLLRGGQLALGLGQGTSAVAALARAASLLHRETEARIVLFGGGFSRAALIAACSPAFAAENAA